MFNKIYKIAIDSNNGEESVKTLLNVFNLYGDVKHIVEKPIENVKTKEIVYKVIVFELKTNRSNFRKLLTIMKESGHPLYQIKGYWFM